MVSINHITQLSAYYAIAQHYTYCASCAQIAPNFSGQGFIQYVKQLPMTLWYFSNATALAILST